jgi:hypothetical protein
VGSVVAADMTAPTSLYKAPAQLYDWIGLYFAGSASHGWDVSTNPAFAFGYVGRGTDFGADVFPPLLPNAFLNLSEAIRATSVRADDNSLFFGIDGSNSDGNYNKRKVTGPGVPGQSLMGTLSYKFDWQ